MSTNQSNPGTALATRHPDEKQDFMPIMTIDDAIARYDVMVALTKRVMQENKDFGKIPGTDKNTLLKPGAEKLCSIFGLCVEDPEIVEKVEDWTGKDHGEPFFFYLVRQRLTRNGKTVASQVGSCNSWESKYRYHWVGEDQLPDGMERSKLKTRGGRISEFTFAIDKAETGGKYGKPADYWQRFKDAIEGGAAKKIRKKTGQGKEYDAWEIDSTLYRIPNPDAANLVNTVLKMAQKRAFVSAVLMATNASEFYTTDVEDMEYIGGEAHGDVVDAEFAEAKPREQHAQSKPANGTPKPAPAKSHAPPKTPREFDTFYDGLVRWCVEKGKATPEEVEEETARYAESQSYPSDYTQWDERAFAAVYLWLKDWGQKRPVRQQATSQASA